VWINESARPIKCNKFNIVAYLLKARNVEPDKQLFLAYGSETTFVSSQRSQTNRFPRQQAAHNSGGTVGIIFYSGPCRGLIRKLRSDDLVSWKGAAIQRGLEPRSRGIVTAGAVTRQLLVKTL
jgi:hypothetical protein